MFREQLIYKLHLELNVREKISNQRRAQSTNGMHSPGFEPVTQGVKRL